MKKTIFIFFALLAFVSAFAFSQDGDSKSEPQLVQDSGPKKSNGSFSLTVEAAYYPDSEVLHGIITQQPDSGFFVKLLRAFFSGDIFMIPEA